MTYETAEFGNRGSLPYNRITQVMPPKQQINPKPCGASNMPCNMASSANMTPLGGPKMQIRPQARLGHDVWANGDRCLGG